MIVYLAGPIQNVSKSESTDRRRHLSRFLSQYGITTLDPTRNQDLKMFNDGTCNSKAIVELGIADINQSDILIAYTPTSSVGTSMEIFCMAHDLKRPVYVVCPYKKALSPWTEYFATKVFKSFEELIVFLIEELSVATK